MWRILVPVLIVLALLSLNDKSQEEMTLTINEGEGIFEISDKVSVDRSSFILSTVLKGKWRQLQAGSYLIPAHSKVGEIVDIISQGRTIYLKVTVPECSTVEETDQIFSDVLDRKVSLSKDKEGYLFPDTYYVEPDITDEEIVEKMLSNFDKKFSEDKDTLVMASILESELQNQDDMKMVSDLLWRRLGIGMALQVDVSPYTYERRGLPPTPLCSPGLKGIEAALNPTPNEYWYYFNTSEGDTVFSETFEEHQERL